MRNVKNVADKHGRIIAFAYSYYSEKKKTEYLYVPTCPHCGGNHLHGSTQKIAGVRALHCAEDIKGEYHVICLGDMPALVKRHFDHNWEGL